jgi:hypothetical protein
MDTIWNGLGVHARLLETALCPRLALFCLSDAKMRCNVISILDTKYYSYPHTQPFISTVWPPVRVRASPPSIITKCPVYQNPRSPNPPGIRTAGPASPVVGGDGVGLTGTCPCSALSSSPLVRGPSKGVAPAKESTGWSGDG